jgi:hypothetical protein
MRKPVKRFRRRAQEGLEGERILFGVKGEVPFMKGRKRILVRNQSQLSGNLESIIPDSKSEESCEAHGGDNIKKRGLVVKYFCKDDPDRL